MALVLEIRKGEGFYLDDQLVTVEEIYALNRFKVMVHDKHMPVTMEVTNKAQTQVIPDVYVQAGKDDPSVMDGTACKIAIDAPPRVRILREELYEQGVR